ncbi:MAG: hypothetical protein ACFCGT_08685 [Sandaracinaceae bacterium]
MPALGTVGEAALDCGGRFAMPAELLDADGLGQRGWTFDDLRFPYAWNLRVTMENRWISTSPDNGVSLRVHPERVPEAGRCVQGLLSEAEGTAAALEALSAFAHDDVAFDALARDRYAPGADPVDGDAEGSLLLRALRGLVELPNERAGAPEVAWASVDVDALRADLAPWPAAARAAVARLVLAYGEALLLVRGALASADPELVQEVFFQVEDESTATFQNTFVFPRGGTISSDLRELRTSVDRHRLEVAGQRLTGAAEDAASALAAVGPFEGAVIDVATPHGRVVLAPSASSDVRSAEDLEGVGLLVDLGGDDRYGGRVGSTQAAWMGAGVLVDVAGEDAYGPATPDVADPRVDTADAFDHVHGLTQGFGLFGVGVLVDHAGADTYAASAYAQGAGMLGVGVLADHAGPDRYRVAYFGQGASFLGTGLLADRGGADRYRLYTMGMGVGKPGGVGVLLDGGGDDDYLCYHADDPPELPSPGYPNRYGISPDWPYNDGEEAHYMSVCQGVGWGYRGDWFDPPGTWAGGFGALVDLGTGDDLHTADTMSMGMGFVYGFGFLYDGGGADRYRTFWWGPAASAHMGVGLLIDDDGADDYFVTRASGGWGYDWGVGWLVEGGGDDRYGGQMHYGEAYTYGLTFFLELGGDDTYNVADGRRDPWFGVVRRGAPGVRLVGAFLDLGGGEDAYLTGREGPANDTVWSHPAVGEDVDPDLHLGVGVDR